jgi:hypothetical protein
MLTGKEIIAIIKAAAQSGVNTLEVADIKVTFKDAALYTGDSSKIPKLMKLDEVSEEAEISADEKSLQKELDEHLLNLTDPLAYETLKLGNA